MVIRIPGMLPIESDAEMKAFDDKCFAAFMVKVDEKLESLCGMSSSELDDINYREMYEDGQTPNTCARKAIRRSGG